MEGLPRTPEKNEYVPLSKQIEQKLGTLEQERAISVDMQVSPEEQEVIDRILIERSLEQFDFYGSNPDELKAKLEIYFAEMGENSSEDLATISNIIGRVSEATQVGLKGESTWTMVRVSLPNNDFEIPRWHPDGKYYHSISKQYKLVATVKGAQTRFANAINQKEVTKLQQQESENYDKNASNPELFNTEDIRIRTELAEAVREKEIGIQGQAVIYLVGEDHAVLHSEPHITESRIFFAVLPGSNEEISQWEANMRG